MKALIRKIETVNMDVKNEEGEKHTLPFVKLSVYLPMEEAGNILHLRDHEIYLSEQEPTGQAGYHISEELRGNLLKAQNRRTWNFQRSLTNTIDPSYPRTKT